MKILISTVSSAAIFAHSLQICLGFDADTEFVPATVLEDCEISFGVAT